ncbi:hypothetical protein LTR85_011586 [Meristemomyces frigidus]|nr:hypothetical protein LTR85_011586 [Meristemomyces frigidus]
MCAGYLSEKVSLTRRRRDESNRSGLGALVAFQHILLWSSAYVLASEVYMIVTGVVTAELLPTAIVLLASAGISILYIGLHSLTAILTPRAHTKRSDNVRRAMQLAASALFVILNKTSEPFRGHLFGITKEPALLPLMLPYKSAAQRAMFSEMSFKCRSSTSLSSRTLVPSTNNSTAHLLPTCPEKAIVGLGIYAPKAYTPSFLTPRPSLSSIRTHTTMRSLQPPCSPLPPLPAYFPEKYRKPSAMDKAVHPPRPSRPYRPSRTHSEKTVRIVPPSPALSRANLAAFNQSAESLSSVYSRSVSGEERGARPTPLSESSRSYSSGSTATVVKSPLCAMRRADDPDTVVILEHRARRSSDSSDSDIDDADMLQAKLPSVKAVSDFGEVEIWQAKRQNHASYHQRARELDREGTMRRLEFTPLTIRKTRDSAAMFQG